MIAALDHTKGMTFLAAKYLGCSHDTILRYCQNYPSVQAARDAHRGEMIDTAELKLWQSIQNGEAWGISMALKTLGKDRGYVERSEVTGKDGADLLAALAARLDALPEHELRAIAAPNGPHTNGTADLLPHQEG